MLFHKDMQLCELVSHVETHKVSVLLECYCATFKETDGVMVCSLKKNHSKFVYLGYLAFIVEMSKLVEEDWEVEDDYLVLELYAQFLTSMVSHSKGLVKLRAYIRAAIMEQVGFTLEFDPYMKDMAAHDTVEAQGLCQIALNIARWVPTQVRKCVDFGADCIIDAFKKHFDKILVQYCAEAYTVCSWITNVWEMIKNWIREAMQSVDWFLSGCQELLTWGMCIIASSCALGLLEKIMITLGLISESFDLVGIFVRSAIVGAFIVTSRTTGAFKTPELVTMAATAVGVVAQAMTSVFSMKGKDDTTAEPQAGVVEMLESLATNLTKCTDNALLSVGKSASAFNQICTAATTIKGLAGKVIGAISNFVRNYLGLSSSMLSDAGVVFSQDVDGWLKQISWQQDQFLLKAYVSQDELLALRALICKGEQLRSMLIKGDTRVSPAVSMLISRGCDELSKLMRDAAMHSVSQIRKIPFVVNAQGESRVGKTLVINKLTDDIVEFLGLDEHSVYSRNAADQYWSGYKRLPIVVMDDFGAVTTEPSAEAQFIPLISSAPHPLNMAALEEKGMHFDSQLVMCSSNFLDCSPESKVRDEMAFRTRRNVLIKVRLDANVPYSEDDFTQNQIYEILEWFHDHYIVKETFTKYVDLLAYVTTEWERHTKEQEANLSKMRAGKNTPDVFTSFQDLVRLATVLSQSSKFMGERMRQTDNRVQFLRCVDGKGSVHHLWVEPNGEISITDGTLDNLDDELQSERDAGKMLTKIYQYLKYHQGTNMLARAHLDSLVYNTAYDGSFKFTGTIGSPAFFAQIKHSIDGLPQWQRAVLCSLGLYMQRTSKKSWYHTLRDTVKQGIETMYKEDIANWPTPLKVIVGITLATMVGTSFWQIFSLLRDSGTGTQFIGNAALAFSGKGGVEQVEAQSWQPNRQNFTQGKYKNMPITRRKWAQAQMSLDQSVMSIMSHCKASLKFGDQVHQIMLLPGRRFFAYRHLAEVLTQPMMINIETDKGSYNHAYDPKCFQFFDESELALYTNGTLEDIPHSSNKLICWDPEKELPAGSFRAELLSCKYDVDTRTFLPEWAEIDATLHKEPVDIMSGTYINKQAICLKYKAATVPLDCGSLVIATINKQKKIVGIHVAGDGKNGYATLIQWVPEEVQAQSAEKYFNFFPEVINATEGVSQVGMLEKGVILPLPKKTNLVETPEEWHLDTPCDKVPSVLTVKDPRLQNTEHAIYDPYISGIQKYAVPMEPLDQELLEEVGQDIVEQWFECTEEGETFEEVDLSVAINGIEDLEYMERIPFATSEGFPHVLSRTAGEKGKKRFVQGVGETFELVPGTSVQIAYEEMIKTLEMGPPTLVGIECPKDEKLPLRKVFTKPKTRCFTILPMEYNLIVRQKFLTFVRFIMRNRSKLPCQVGINPYSNEWTDLAHRLREKGNNILCCDYSSFDGLLTKQVMQIMAAMINKLCGGGPKLCRERENLLLACCSRYAICRGSVWKVECGIPSGFPLTVICNSIFNEMLIRYSYKSLMRSSKAPPIFTGNFEKLVTLVTYGDDNLISVSDQVKGFFNGEKLKHFLAEKSIIITDGKDKTLPFLFFRELEDCDFLKRGFKKLSSVNWVAPIEKESLWSQLHYVNAGSLEMNRAYLVNLNNVLVELYLHSKDEAQDLRRKALHRVSHLRHTEVLNVSQIELFHASQRDMNRPFSMDAVDDLMNVDLISCGKGVFVESVFEISDKAVFRDLSSYSRADVNKETEFCVLGNTFYPNQLLEPHEMQIRFDVGEGRGGLPTTNWLESSVKNRNSTINKRLRQAVSEKKRLVFMSRGGCYVSIIVAVLFCAKNGWIKREHSNIFLSKCMKDLKKYKFLFDECEFAFLK
uniref:RNA1 polyprotein n=1 Tax=Bean rugose mosaic virus TaxID=128790 RepID=A0A1S6XZH3_9SECO|nr:polyprotein [Bean rugose mosaic virus]